MYGNNNNPPCFTCAFFLYQLTHIKVSQNSSLFCFIYRAWMIQMKSEIVVIEYCSGYWLYEFIDKACQLIFCGNSVLP